MNIRIRKYKSETKLINGKQTLLAVLFLQNILTTVSTDNITARTVLALIYVFASFRDIWDE